MGVDVQELTESMNAKSLNYWLSKLVQELVANKSGGRIPLGRFTV